MAWIGAGLALVCLLGVLALVWGCLRAGAEMEALDEELEAQARYRQWKADQDERHRRALLQLQDEFKARQQQRRPKP